MNASPFQLSARIGARQSDHENGRARLALDVDRAAVLLDYDVVAERQAKPGAFACRLRGEEWIEHFLFDMVRNAGPIVLYRDLDAVPEIASRSSKRRLVARLAPRSPAFRDRVEAVG